MKAKVTLPAGALLAAGAVFVGVVGIAGSAPTGTPVDHQAAAQRLLKIGAERYMTPAAQSGLRMLASGNRQFSQAPEPSTVATIARGGAPEALTAGLPNVRVNDPAGDTHQIDQTTQSEPSLTVAGQHVAVGFNDSQQTLPFFTAASTLTGYAYSSDGGQTFTDGGALPNAPEFVNLGDPWLASDRHGTMYFSNLAIDGFYGNLDVGVSRSTDGGRTWTPASPITRPGSDQFYSADKDAITTGRDPLVPGRDDVYAAWDDFVFNNAGASTGLPVAHSTDGGASWTVTYADQSSLSGGAGCSFSQYIGAQPIVNPADGTVYVVAEKIAVVDPNCNGGSPTFSEVVFRSTDGGQMWGPGVTIARVTTAVPNGLLGLAPGQYMRDLEFPTAAFLGGALYVAWNDGASGLSHIRLARSTTGGRTWALSWVTHGANDEVQPALSADSALHLAYLRRNGDNTLDVLQSSSMDGRSFTTNRVTSQSFPGVFTIPQFDPVIAFGYMGDYIANASDGSRPYFAWGDNRDTVTDALWPHGRHDPNVYFAKG